MREYTDTHEWVETVEGIATVGITTAAVSEIGDIVYVELPKIDKSVEKGTCVCIVESTKAAVDIESPVSGTIIAVNEALQRDISLLNKKPESDGWLFKIRVT